MRKIISPVFTTLLLASTLCAPSCTKFLEVGPPKTEVATSEVFNSDLVAASAVLGIYNDMMASGGNTLSYKISSLLGQAADEMQTAENPPQSNYYTNNLLSTAQNDDFWSNGYKYIYYANLAIENLSASTNLTPAIKQQLLGETIFIRAFMHFYLVNLFGNIPYVTGTDYKVTNNVPRMPADYVYSQIISDLKTAKLLLTDSFPDPLNVVPPAASQQRIRPNKGAAGALLARVYLYQKDWVNAQLEADTLIRNTTNYNLLSSLDAIFLKNSRETIWSLPTSDPSTPNTFEANKYILTSAPSFFGQVAVSLTNNFYNTAFEPGDKRKTSWTGAFTSTGFPAGTWYYAAKYKATGLTSTPSEYWIVLRLAEQYLIRAEALAHQDKVADAVKDINVLRQRARISNTDLPDIAANVGQDSCLSAIMQERRVELFAEGGHRWLDLKRTDKANAVLKVVKGDVNWQSTDVLFPIPDTQLLFDPEMTGHQNLGY